MRVKIIIAVITLLYSSLGFSCEIDPPPSKEEKQRIIAEQAEQVSAAERLVVAKVSGWSVRKYPDHDYQRLHSVNWLCDSIAEFKVIGSWGKSGRREYIFIQPGSCICASYPFYKKGDEYLLSVVDGKVLAAIGLEEARSNGFVPSKEYEH
jgi:hypothetical protein